MNIFVVLGHPNLIELRFQKAVEKNTNDLIEIKLSEEYFYIELKCVAQFNRHVSSP